MKLDILAGTTSRIIDVFIQDSSSTVGAGLTGLVFNTASLTGYYYLNDAPTGATSITLATMTVGTWATGGFVATDATNMPGMYQLGIPNAALTGANSVVVYLKGAANMAPVVLEIQLTAYNPYAALATPTNITAGTITTATNVTTVNGLAANVITAAAIADAAIDNATFAADVGTTAYATNNIALAANKGADNVLNVTTFAEPGQGTPAATTTLAQKIGYLYKALINRTTSSTTEIKMYDNAGTVVDQKLTHSDNGTTYDRGTMGTGP
jgi:hypothetical protein